MLLLFAMWRERAGGWSMCRDRLAPAPVLLSVSAKSSSHPLLSSSCVWITTSMTSLPSGNTLHVSLKFLFDHGKRFCTIVLRLSGFWKFLESMERWFWETKDVKFWQGFLSVLYYRHITVGNSEFWSHYWGYGLVSVRGFDHTIERTGFGLCLWFWLRIWG